ncbi:uracil-DNA glycosylase [Rhodobacteraceae bacterium KMS-5]|uniref:Type-4 uracil-DNA glycosylase n=1 Tax=Tabrizicola oligotrophica TaxID=2710650 RepID=A0A6M0QTN2_9RHOB|nr:uracil-DNA glycosylase [Tabrizicola oligotrophica]
MAGDWHAALAALAWQVDLGVDEVIGDTAIDRYELPETNRPAAPPAVAPRAPAPVMQDAPQVDPVEAARGIAARATSLEALREALSAFDLCDLKKGARNTVFADGNPAARVLILGEAPGREEDIEGRPFVGRAGQLLDRMFAAIGLARTAPDAGAALYITNVMPWRPPGNRDPEPAEVAMMRPFVERHIALMDPDVIVVMGNTPLFALTGHKGIMRAHGTWTKALDRPLLPMVHPAYLLRNPIAKREAWADLLSLQAHLRANG